MMRIFHVSIPIKKILPFFKGTDSEKLRNEFAKAHVEFFSVQISALEKEVERMKESEDENYYNLSYPNYELDCPYRDFDYLSKVIDTYACMYKHVLKHKEFYETTVQKEIISRYFELMQEFDRQVQRFDADWPSI